MVKKIRKSPALEKVPKETNATNGMVKKIRKSPALEKVSKETNATNEIQRQYVPPPATTKPSRDKPRTVSERLAIVNDLGDKVDARAIEDVASRHNIQVQRLKSWLKDAELFRFLESEGMGELTRVSKKKYQDKFEQGSPTCDSDELVQFETSTNLQGHERSKEISCSEYAVKSSGSNEAQAVPPSSGLSRVDDTPESCGNGDSKLFYSSEESSIGPKQSQGHKGKAGSAPEWYYVDLQHVIQGPFDRQLMRGWWFEGYLNKDLPISPIRDGPFVSLAAVFPEGDAFGDS